MKLKNTLSIKNITASALCVALCVLLPILFHAVPNAGSVFLPMHIPVLICGLLCGWQYGLVCGVLGPVLSTLFTGMPPVAYLPSMAIELAVYGLVSGLLIKFVRLKDAHLNLYISLIGAMLCGRIVSGVLNALIFRAGSYTFQAWLAASFITALPGVAIQIVLIPTLVFALKKAVSRRAPANA